MINGNGVVQTAFGTVQGTEEKEGMTLFRGIPYAAPPVGARRFRPPEPPMPWQGIRKCAEWGAACAQPTPHTPQTPYGVEFYFGGDYPPAMDEDCLYLNLWTPAASETEKLPVMLWLHGGGAQTGYGHEREFDGTSLCTQGVILITINYRLNLFGFFAHPELSAENAFGASGNYGLMDQIQALRWIRENVHAFGGDADNITLFGQSSGGRAVQALCCSPLTKGWIHHAVIQSAGRSRPSSDCISLREAEENGISFMREYGISSIAGMREIPWQQLLLWMGDYFARNGFARAFTYCTDGFVLKKSMEDSLRNGHEHEMDYMIGHTAEEVAASSPGETSIGQFQLAWAQRRAKSGRGKMYVYRFARKLPGRKAYSFHDEAFHSAELWYVFGTLERSWRPFTAADAELSRRMVRYWTNFAKNGNPNEDGLSPWQPCAEEDDILLLDAEPPAI